MIAVRKRRHETAKTQINVRQVKELRIQNPSFSGLKLPVCYANMSHRAHLNRGLKINENTV